MVDTIVVQGGDAAPDLSGIPRHYRATHGQTPTFSEKDRDASLGPASPGQAQRLRIGQPVPRPLCAALTSVRCARSLALPHTICFRYLLTILSLPALGGLAWNMQREITRDRTWPKKQEPGVREVEAMDAQLNDPVPLKPSLEPIDAASLIDHFDGDIEMLTMIGGVFLQEIPIQLSAVRTAVKQHDAPALARSSHTLRGSVGVFGAKDACELARQLESLGNATELAAAERIYETLERHVFHLGQVLGAALSAAGTEPVRAADQMFTRDISCHG